MAGYTQPRIFRSNRQGQFTRFLNRLHNDDYEEHVQAEVDRLNPVFEAISKAVLPYAENDHQNVRLKAKRIADAFASIGRCNGFLAFGMPLIIPEKNFIFPTIKSVYVDSEYGRSKTRHMKPDGYKRMFWTSAFGLLGVKHYERQNTYIYPTNTIPEEFLNIEGIEPVIKAAGHLAALVNHDYFHQIIYCAIDDSFRHRDEQAFLMQYIRDIDRKLERAW